MHLQKTNEVSLPRSEQQQQQKHTIESGKTIEKAKPNEKRGGGEKRESIKVIHLATTATIAQKTVCTEAQERIVR